MTDFIRNPEIRRTIIITFVVGFVLTFAGFLHDTTTGLLLMLTSIFFFSLHFTTTFRRYQKLRRLSKEIDSMLHSQTPIQFKDYKEGELAILQNELSKMTQRLLEQTDALKTDKKYLSDAMADISHQLRSPLTASQLILSLLKDPHLSTDKRRELLQELSQLFSRIDWLIETLLKMSKMDAGTAYLAKEPVLISELLEKACEPLLIPMELREQTLILPTHQVTSEAESSTSVVNSVSSSLSESHLANESFLGDLSWTTEAILNILKNCMEHTPIGGTITVSCQETALYTELVIEDNGPGFSPEDLPHLFERFYKGKNSSEQSVGIGLALSRMIIAHQNGTVKAENLVTGGACFTIKFYK